MAKTDIQIGSDFRSAAAEVATAWKATATEQPAEATDRIYFRDWTALCAVLTPKRYELLRHLRQSPADGVRALARSLGRDVKRVHEDVVSLAELGLVDREDSGRLSSAGDEITSTIRIAA